MDIIICDGCEENNETVTYCVECTQNFCSNCTTAHTRQNATKTHILLRIFAEDTTTVKIGIPCKICDSKKEVVNLCVICQELYCEDCSKRHNNQRVTQDHHLFPIQLWDSSLVGQPTESVVLHKLDAQVGVRQVHTPARELYKGDLFIEKPCDAPGETEVTRIRGMTMLSDGRLVLIDSKNNCLTIFKDGSYDFASKKDLGDEPRGITSVTQDEVAITFDHKKMVILYKIDKAYNLWKQRSFGVKEKPFSISYSKKTFAIEVGEGDDGKIAITDLNGNLTHLVRGQSSTFGQFTGNTIRLAHDHDKKIVFVVNVSDGFLHCVDYTGTVKWVVNIKMPRGITLHERTLFVASKGDNKIYQVDTADGRICDLLSVEDKINQPRYISYQHVKNKLVVEIGSNVNIYNVVKNS